MDVVVRFSIKSDPFLLFIAAPLSGSAYFPFPFQDSISIPFCIGQVSVFMPSLILNQDLNSIQVSML